MISSLLPWLLERLFVIASFVSTCTKISLGNHRIANAISKILGTKLGQFPFLYLGVPISPKKLLINQLSFLPSRVNLAIHAWNYSSISTAGRVVLLNNTIFAIHDYYLSVMNLPKTILDSISKQARNFSRARMAIAVASTRWDGSLLLLTNLREGSVFVISSMLNML